MESRESRAGGELPVVVGSWVRHVDGRGDLPEGTWSFGRCRFCTGAGGTSVGRTAMRADDGVIADLSAVAKGMLATFQPAVG
ncbi:hypothetical protein ABIA38_007593 [Embleya sp. AB8]